MLSLLVIFLVSNVKSQRVCIWNRIDANNYNIGVNGLYEADGLYNGVNSYVKTTDCANSNPLYVYRVGNQWRIGETKADNVGSLAQCTQTDLSSCTSNTWTIYQNDLNGNEGYSVDAAMYAQLDECPSWDCATVTSAVIGTGANCQSFDQQLAPNAYKNSAGYVWYFQPIFQEWWCINSNTYTYTSCQAQFSAATSSGWADLSAGNSLSLTYTSISGNSASTAYEVTCSGTGSNFPSPTGSPTDPTPEPSSPPTTPSTVIPSSTSYCIYGRSGDNSVINGYWEPTGRSVNGYQTYSKSIGGNANQCPVVGTLYLYVYGTNGNQWYIGSSEDSSSYYARCGRETSVSYPACDSDGWYVYAGTTVQDKGVGIATEAECPSKFDDCTSITTNINTGTDCTGPFAKMIDGTPNAYYNADAALYFYYIPYLDEWVCGTTLDSINTCPYTYSGGSTLTGFDISCTGSPAPTRDPTTTTLKPTGSPVASANTPGPTRSPQTSGSNVTPYPTKAPTTRSPTKAPTTRTPTKSPTLGPAYCVSGRSGTNTGINGYYEDTGEFENWYSLYKKTVSGSCAQDTIYLYRVDNFWYIGYSRGDTSTYLASCRRNTRFNTPVCGDAGWSVYTSNTLTADSDVTITQTDTCASTCDGTGTPAPTRAPSRGSGNNNNNNNNNNTPSPTTAPNKSSNNNNNNNNNDNNNNNNDNNNNNNGSGSGNSSNALYTFYAIALSLIFGLFLIV